MKHIILNIAIALVFVMCSCGANNSSVNSDNETECLETVKDQADSIGGLQDYSDLIKTVYEKFVFAIDADPEVYSNPERYFTENALKRLRESYDFDFDDDNCYAYSELRTQEQDSKPGTTGESYITEVESACDDWFVVKYSDMGWSGMTRIKIVDGKIDDFTRCAEDL